MVASIEARACAMNTVIHTVCLRIAHQAKRLISQHSTFARSTLTVHSWMISLTARTNSGSREYFVPVGAAFADAPFAGGPFEGSPCEGDEKLMIRTAILSALNKQNHANITLRNIIHPRGCEGYEKKGTDQGCLIGRGVKLKLSTTPQWAGWRCPITRPIERGCLRTPWVVAYEGGP